MADILEFHAPKASPTRAVKSDLPAKVIIFPGVRIDRDSFSLADRIPSRSTKAPARKTAAKADD